VAAKIPHALDYLFQVEPPPPPTVCAVFGDEAFLRREVLRILRVAVLGKEEGDFSYSALEGDRAAWPAVADELATLPMFGGGKRLIVLLEADDFVKRYRTELEDYIARPSRTGVLVLELDSLPANTRLYKLLAERNGLIACSAPKEAQLAKWLTDWATRRHGVGLTPAAAEMLVELVGPELGLLDQELAKLALTAEPGKKISQETIARSVGSWRAKTAWVMLDAALDGKPAEALRQLDRLLAAGEQPVGILAQIATTLRRLAAATRIVIQAEAAGRRPVLASALEQAGVNSYYVKNAEKQLRRLTRRRGAKLYDWLLEADLDLKGESHLSPRLILERLLIRLSSPPELLKT
jgi:DNA polymerase III subunit delta